MLRPGPLKSVDTPCTASFRKQSLDSTKMSWTHISSFVWSGHIVVFFLLFLCLMFVWLFIREQWAIKSISISYKQSMRSFLSSLLFFLFLLNAVGTCLGTSSPHLLSIHLKAPAVRLKMLTCGALLLLSWKSSYSWRVLPPLNFRLKLQEHFCKNDESSRKDYF